MTNQDVPRSPSSSINPGLTRRNVLKGMAGVAGLASFSGSSPRAAPPHPQVRQRAHQPRRRQPLQLPPPARAGA